MLKVRTFWILTQTMYEVWGSPWWKALPFLLLSQSGACLLQAPKVLLARPLLNTPRPARQMKDVDQHLEI